MTYNKEVQSRYRRKTAQFKVEYSLADEDQKETSRIRAYLKESGQSANAYLKALIKADLDAKGVPYPDNEEI